MAVVAEVVTNVLPVAVLEADPLVVMELTVVAVEAQFVDICLRVVIRAQDPQLQVQDLAAGEELTGIEILLMAEMVAPAYF